MKRLSTEAQLAERLRGSLALTKLVRRRRVLDDARFDRIATREGFVAYMRGFLHDLDRDIAAEDAGEPSLGGYRALFREDGSFFAIANVALGPSKE